MSDSDERIFIKLDAISKDISEMKTTQVVQQEILREHTRRSELNEEAVKLLKEDIKPLKKGYDNVQGVIKFLGVIALFVTTISGILKLFKIL